MPTYYDSKKLIPVQSVNIAKEQIKSDDGRNIGTVFKITVRGTLVAYKGSPDSTGAFWTDSGYPPDEEISHDYRLKSILTKQGALCHLFSTQGLMFEVQPLDGSAPFKCNPRVLGIEFVGDLWVEKCEYIINLEADKVWFGAEECGADSGTDNISQSSEEWSIEPADDKVLSYRLTHTISATGKQSFNETGAVVQEGWENAKDYVIAKLGIDITIKNSELVLSLADYGAYNYGRSQSLDELNGRFTVTETWLLYEAGAESPAIEDFTINTRIGQDRTSVTIDGTISGLESRNNTTFEDVTQTKYGAALGKFNDIEGNLLTRAQNYSGVTLNPSVLNRVIAKNPGTGVITYNYEYDNRPSASISGALSEIITVTTQNAADVFAEIAVLARSAGPILQDIGTVTSKSKSLSIDASLTPSVYGGVPASEPNTDSIILLYVPVATQVFLSRDEISWSPNTGRYSRNTSWVYQ